MSETSGTSQFRIKLSAPIAQGVPTLDDAADLEISKVSQDPEEMKFRVRELPFPSEGAYLWRSNEERPAMPPLAPIVVTQDVLRAANAHVSQSDEYEIGGFLLGNRCRCPDTDAEYIIIDQVTEAKHTQATPTSLKFTTETWSQLKDDLSGKFIGKLCVGWYHSHPKMDVFLSGYDEAIQKTYFSEPWNSALVIEPTKRRGGFFCWRAEGMNLNTPDQFYELLERNSDATVLDWANYECVDQRTGEVIRPPAAAPPQSAAGDSHNPHAARDGEAGGASAVGWPNAAARREARLRGKWPPGILILAGVAALVLVVTTTFILARRFSGVEAPSPSQARLEDKVAAGIDVLDDLAEKQVVPPESLSISMTLIGPLTDPKVEVDGNEAEIKKVKVVAVERVDVKAVAKLGDKIARLRQDLSAEERIQVRVMDRQRPEAASVTFYITLRPSDVSSRSVSTPTPESARPKPTQQRPVREPRQNVNAGRPANVNQANANAGVGQPTPVAPTPSSSPNLAAPPQQQATPPSQSPSASPAVTPPPKPSPTPSSKEKKEQLEKSQKVEETWQEANQKAQRKFLEVERERRLRLASSDDEKRRIKSEFKTREENLKTAQANERENMNVRHKGERERLKGEQ